MPDLSEAEPTDDLVRPFQLTAPSLRGRLARLGPALDRIIARHAYPEAVAAMLGQAVALAALLAGALKYEGVFTLQTRSDGPIRLLVADVTSEGAVRGYAQYDDGAVAAATGSGAPVPRLLGAGHLAFTVDQGEHAERYQGIVALEGATLAECAHHYFRQSEQIEAGLTVAAAKRESGWRAGGIMLQRIPAEGGVAESRAAEAEDDGWRLVLGKLGTCSEAELTNPSLGADGLLYRLFHEEAVRVFPAHPLVDRCRCSRARIESVLRSLPEDDLAHVAADGQAEVTCEFCSTVYRFTEAELAALRRRAV
ncbi:MAG TPA: Hsp33 family molecular chaperone HslO [Stellaceae bacterium]|nr:Hsp33 family molecular chaperone HslO [Stellaceae bacterium]